MGIWQKIFGGASKPHNLGIALSGGGARGFAHLGVLKALEEKGIKPEVISGTSAGAIAGAFLAAGKSPDEAFEIIKHYKFFDFTTIRIPRTGLFNLDSLRASIKKEIPQKRIEDLPKPLFITAANMLDGKVEYFSEGPLAEIVQASASIPVLFSPVTIDGKMYSDGGVLDNLPLRPILGCCKKTIMVNISPLVPIKEMKNIFQVATRMLQMSVNAREGAKKKRADVYIEPGELDKFEIHDTKHAQEIFDVGHYYTKELAISL